MKLETLKSPCTEIAERPGVGCTSHVAGTYMLSGGSMFLGLPKGFNRLGTANQDSFEIFDSMEQALSLYPNLNTIFSVPVWIHIDEYGNTLTRWYSPRTNAGWTMVILGDHSDHPRFANTIRITEEQIDKMD